MILIDANLLVDLIDRVAPRPGIVLLAGRGARRDPPRRSAVFLHPAFVRVKIHASILPPRWGRIRRLRTFSPHSLSLSSMRWLRASGIGPFSAAYFELPTARGARQRVHMVPHSQSSTEQRSFPPNMTLSVSTAFTSSTC